MGQGYEIPVGWTRDEVPALQNGAGLRVVLGESRPLYGRPISAPAFLGMLFLCSLLLAVGALGGYLFHR
jgi:hypothetical protein